MAETKRIISVQGAREHNLKNVSIELPLWQGDRIRLLTEMIEQRHFHVIVSCTKEPPLSNGAAWIGRRLDRQALRELDQFDMDVTGENGEYHTMVLSTPSYAYPLQLVVRDDSTTDIFLELKDQPGQKEQRWCVCSPHTKLKKGV